MKMNVATSENPEEITLRFLYAIFLKTHIHMHQNDIYIPFKTHISLYHLLRRVIIYFGLKATVEGLIYP